MIEENLAMPFETTLLGARMIVRTVDLRAGESAERRRREQEAAAARAKRLEVLARNPAKAWKQVDALIDAKRAKEYDAAVTLLEDLHALTVRNDDLAGFAVRMGRLREQNPRRPSLIDRFDRARLP